MAKWLKAAQINHPSVKIRLSLLRGLLILDATVLFLLGALLIFAPGQVTRAFGFIDLPPTVGYLIGMWGCLFATLGLGYLAAASNPLRHLVWVQVAIVRGALECVLGLVYLARGTVTFQQAGLGIVVAALISIAYLALYPRRPRLVLTPTTSAPPLPPSS